MIKYTIETKYNKDIIEQTIMERDELQDSFKVLWRDSIKLKEEGMRKALMEIGWTPPEDKPNYESWIRRVICELEEEGFGDDLDTFKSWLVFSAKAEDDGGDYVEMLDIGEGGLV